MIEYKTFKMNPLYCTFAVLTLLTTVSVAHANGSEAILDSTPLMSTQELESLSHSCQQDVLALHEMRRQVAPNAMKEYGITLSNASQACDKLNHAVKELRKVRKYKDEYERNMVRAKVCAGHKSSFSAGSISSEPLIDPLAPSKDPSHVDSAPLPLDERNVVD